MVLSPAVVVCLQFAGGTASSCCKSLSSNPIGSGAHGPGSPKRMNWGSSNCGELMLGNVFFNCSLPSVYLFELRSYVDLSMRTCELLEFAWGAEEEQHGAKVPTTQQNPDFDAGWRILYLVESWLIYVPWSHNGYTLYTVCTVHIVKSLHQSV